jgi:hypothetical protein
MQDAMRGVVVRVIRDAAANGLPGKHHFLVSFRTHHQGVELSEDLRARYPQNMTIVLQHQYWDLKADEDGFSVTLSFSKVPQRLRVPFGSITGFVDPEAKFELHFAPTDAPAAASAVPAALPTSPAAVPTVEHATPSVDGKVVTLEQFRRK